MRCENAAAVDRLHSVLFTLDSAVHSSIIKLTACPIIICQVNCDSRTVCRCCLMNLELHAQIARTVAP
jgi:hypothetical protein